MTNFFVSDTDITIASFLLPLLVVVVVWCFFRSSLREGNLSRLFLDTYTLFAAAIVMLGVLVPQVFEKLAENKTFLIVVSLSVVLNAMSHLASVISEARSRFRETTMSRMSDKVN